MPTNDNPRTERSVTERCQVAVHDDTGRVEGPDRWSDLLAGVLERSGVVAPAEASLTFVDTRRMGELNAEHMGGEGPTDVLSFPIDDEADDLGGSGVRLVGDIVICPDVCERNAADHAGTLDDEYALLVVHGGLHLMGHDHAEGADRARMWRAEQELLAELWRPLPETAWSDS